MTLSAQKTLNGPVLAYGVYTMGNDAVLEWFLAFIHSFRTKNPTMPLTVIPYPGTYSRILSLATEYAYTIMEEARCSEFDAFEGIIMRQGRNAGMFRKWACFFGPYTNFAFLDADIVVTSSFDDTLSFFSTSPYDFVYYDYAMSMVYTPESAPEMAALYGSTGFNAGAFISRKSAMSYSELMQLVQKATQDRDKFVIDQADQPFLNYAFDVSRRKTANIQTLLPRFASFAWARFPFTYDWKMNEAINSEGKYLPFVHWAGCAYPTMVRPEVFLWHRTSGLPLPARIGYYLLFYFYRYRAYFLKAKKQISKVIGQFFMSKEWRKFYLCKLIGIKIDVPI